MSNIEIDKINNVVIQKQHLTDETKGDSLVSTVKDIGGLHSTSPTTPYLSLFARMKKFERTDLENELYKKKTLGKIRYVRTTVHILPKDFISTAFAATKATTEPKSVAYSKFLGVSEKQYKDTSQRIVSLLKIKGGKTVKQIKEQLHTTLNVSPIVNLMCDQGILIRGAPEKGWKSNLHTYHLLSEYFPNIKLDELNEEEAKRKVVEKYISCFGPVTEIDISWWTSFTKSQIKQILNELNDKVIQITDSASGIYIMLSEQVNTLISANQIKEDTVNLLPGLDPYVMGYKERDRYLDSKNYNYIFDSAGNAASTILLNGKIVGIWDAYEKPNNIIKLFLFEDIKNKVLEQIRLSAKRVGKFMLAKEAQIKECDSMTPLTRRTAGGVMTPLKDS